MRLALLAICGWEATAAENSIRCTLCSRTIGLWNFAGKARHRNECAVSTHTVLYGRAEVLNFYCANNRGAARYCTVLRCTARWHTVRYGATVVTTMFCKVSPLLTCVLVRQSAVLQCCSALLCHTVLSQQCHSMPCGRKRRIGLDWILILILILILIGFGSECHTPWALGSARCPRQRCTEYSIANHCRTDE